MFLGIGMHVHEEVKKMDDFVINLGDGNVVSVEMKVNMILVSDVICQFVD